MGFVPETLVINVSKDMKKLALLERELVGDLRTIC